MTDLDKIPFDERRGRSTRPPRRYRYRTYGLVLSSQLKLPELIPAVPSDGEPDVEILATSVPPMLEKAAAQDALWQFTEDRCQFSVGGIARYRIEQGQRILVDRRGSATPRPGDVRLYLLGSALGALLHQRQCLPLHVSALETPTGVWAFTGPSGAGKSTLAAWLHFTLGWPIVSDDVAVIQPGEEQPRLHPGPPRLKLWRDALAALGMDHRDLVQDRTRVDKYHLDLRDRFPGHASSLSALVMLESIQAGEAPELIQLKGQEAFRTLLMTVYRPAIAEEIQRPENIFHQCRQLAGRIRVYRYRRPRSLSDLDAAARPLMSEILRAGSSQQ